MGRVKRAAVGKTEYVRVISDIKGVDFSLDPSAIDNGRLPIIENMYRCYSSGDGPMLESIPGYRQITELSGRRINSLFVQKVADGEEYLLIHAGRELYRIAISERDEVDDIAPIASLKDTRSAGFSFGDNFYIIDGESITYVDKEGNAHTTSEDGARYVPTTYRDGEPVEEANLLGGEFIEEATLSDPYRLFYGTKEIAFTVTSHTKRLCTVSGVGAEFSGALYIPPYAKIGEHTYTVTGIAERAFKNNTAISAVIIANGPEKIGRFAFEACTSIKLVSIPDSVGDIGERAFYGCSGINEMYLGEGLTRVDASSFTNCNDVLELHYHSDAEDFKRIEGFDYIPYININYLSAYNEITLRIPLRTKSASVTRVTVGDEDANFVTEMKDGLVGSVIFSYPDMTTLTSKTVRVRGLVDACTPQYATHGQDVREIYPECLPLGCTVAQVFDGRIFLSGNPRAPGMIFFSGDKQRAAEPGLYFGALDYLSVGSSSYKTRAMLAAQDTLAVFKCGDGADGGIFYLKRISLYDRVRTVGYEVNYVHNGIYADGDATAFFDDLLFLSKKGLCGLDKSASGIGRNITCRSEKVNNRLLYEDISGIRMAIWCGYLVLAARNRLYLADSRATYSDKGGRGYEWFYVTGVGGGGDRLPVYRFASVGYGKDYGVYLTPDRIVDKSKSIYKIPDSDYSVMGRSYYTELDGHKYHVYLTDEIRCDDRSPISAVASAGDLLFFGCEDGGIYVFNNDLISSTPDHVTSANEDHTGAVIEGEIHPDYYSFSGVWPRYSIGTGYDDLGVPYMTKSAIYGSLVLTLRARGGARVGIYSGDRDMLSENDAGVGALDFYSLAFDNLTFETEARKKRALMIRERGFAERDLRVICDRPRSPIGIFSIAYRYKICGRIKAR